MATTPNTTHGPTARQVKCAGYLAGGMSPEKAMAKAGYGAGIIPGMAPLIAVTLEQAGLNVTPSTGKGKAAKATEPEPVTPPPAPPAPEPVTNTTGTAPDVPTTSTAPAPAGPSATSKAAASSASAATPAGA